MNTFFKKFSYLIPKNKSESGHQAEYQGGRDWESMYRNRWSYDKVVRSTHGVNCTGSCSWNVFVKNGIVTWENQNHDYPETVLICLTSNRAAVRVVLRSPGICTARCA